MALSRRKCRDLGGDVGTLLPQCPKVDLKTRSRNHETRALLLKQAIVETLEIRPAFRGYKLEESGYIVLEAAVGPSGLKILRTDIRINLLVADVGLPGGLNGRQVADAARVARPKLRVLFVTGYAKNAVVGNGHLDIGMHVIAKPFNMSEFSSKVREMVDN
jgi:CheY-like chemotaxis protein